MAVHIPNIGLDFGDSNLVPDLSGLNAISAFLYKVRNRLQAVLGLAKEGMKKATLEAEAMLKALLGGAGGADELTNSIQKAAAASGKAAKRIVADFDEIQRLGAKSGGSYYTSGLNASIEEAEELAFAIQVLIDKLKEAMTALKTVCAEGITGFFTVVQSGFQELMSVGDLVGKLMDRVCAVFTTGWNSIWSILATTQTRLNEKVIQPVWTGVNTLVGKLQGCFESIRQAAVSLFTGIGVLAVKSWETTAAAWTGAYAWFFGNVTQPIAGLFSKLWVTVSDLTGGGLERLQGMLTALTEWIGTNVIRRLAEAFTQLWENIATGATRTAAGIKDVFTAALQLLGTAFREVWARVMQAFSVGGTVFVDIQDGTESVFKTLINELIKGLNEVLKSAIGGLNTALLSLKNTEIEGQKPFSGLRTVSVPQIPYLAQGAVLPANRPFLAVVGDQKHGTNVEAPLETIQEALALTLEELGAGAEQGEILDVLRQILRAVSGIQIGDEVIGQAAARYNRKMAVVRGGSL